MSGAGFILAINLSVAGFLAAAFLAIAVLDPSRRAARWFALGYVFGMAYFALEFAIRLSGGLPVVGIAASTAFVLALAAFTAGLANLYERPVPWRAIGIVFAIGFMVRLGIEGMPRDDLVRQFFYQAPFTAMQMVGAAVIWSTRRRRPFDIVLFTVVAASAAHYLAKPLIAMVSGGVGDSPTAYIGTSYAMYSQASGAILFVGMALLLFVILVRNLLTAIRTEAVTDKLSDLLNRRGFEERRDAALREHAASNLPLALVLADLDHFKLVNDSHGHASGDRVIAAFAALLRDTLSAYQAAGRIGGEEFAILLPGANLAAARLFAENVRQAFQSTAIEGLPDGHRFSASFGVAEARRGETATELQARADDALYEAKRAGRDCVRVSPPVRIGTPPARTA